MHSNALASISRAILEVDDLLRIPAAPTISLATQGAIGRGAVVLLTSHLERYVRAVNEEVIDHIIACSVHGQALPLELRLLHSSKAIDEMNSAQWLNREPMLKSFLSKEGWLWQHGMTGDLEHRRLLQWMKSPTIENLIRYYKYWGIQDIIEKITRTPGTYRDLRLRLDEVVYKRNNIAHGDLSISATKSDIRKYINAVKVFCNRADAALARNIKKTLHCPKPW